MRPIEIHSIVTRLALSALAAGALALSGCTGGVQVEFEATDASYETDSLEGFARDLERPSIFGTSVDNAPDMRSEALTKLRSQGRSASALADVLTELFPAETRAVPFYAADAKVDGRNAWLVAEVWGSEGGTFDRIRLWALDRETAAILFSATFE